VAASLSVVSVGFGVAVVEAMACVVPDIKGISQCRMPCTYRDGDVLSSMAFAW
jgi:hypothetical protein